MHFTQQPLWLLLDEIEQTLRLTELWQIEQPEPEAFTSREPFCIDTMSAEQWLQWVFLPRMRAIIENDSPLPGSFAITPYFEEALKHYPRDCSALLAVLLRLDQQVGAMC